MGELKVELTRDEWILVLNAAAKQPYEVVATVMQKIQMQLAPQLQPAPQNHNAAAAQD